MPRKVDGCLAHAGRYLNRQAAGRAAIDVGQLHLHGHLGECHERRLAHRRDAACHGGQAEFFYPQAAAGIVCGFATAVFAHKLNPVLAELGSFGNGPLAFGGVAAGGVAPPGDGNVGTFVAARVDDAQQCGVVLGSSQPLSRCLAEKVLHRNRFASAQQAAIQHGVRHGIKHQVGAGGHVEAPRLNAAVPVAPDKGHVGNALLVGCAGADEYFILAIIHAWQGLRVVPDATRIGFAAGQQLAFFVADGNRRIGNGLAGIQRSDPHQRIGTAALEVHAQIGDQGAGAHIHGARALVACV